LRAPQNPPGGVPRSFPPYFGAKTLMAPPDLSIVLVNWNALDLTSQALLSIQEQTKGIEYETFVIDNGTTKDRSVEEIPKRFPWVHFIANPDNRGFSKANNQGIRRARGRYILLLNNDTIQIENALGKAVQYMDAHPDVGALGIVHLNNDATRSFQESYFHFPDAETDIKALFGLPVTRHGAPEVIPPEEDVDWVVGSFLLMRRECFEEVGELDERFFIYDEDVDWCFRARQLKWKVRFWSGAKMVHVGAASRPFMTDKTFVHFRSHLSYIAKHHSLTAAGLYYAGMVMRLTLATTKQLARFTAGQERFDSVRERAFRQRQFLFLRSGRTGG
jgi:GT2 family glycosyltransferase